MDFTEDKLTEKISGTFLEEYPELAKEWFFEKNEENGIYAENYTKSSRTKSWWKCFRKNCHIWEAMPMSRIYHNSGCPVCANKKICPTDYCNSLYVLAPEELKQQWGGDLEDMKRYTMSSNVEVPWVCSRVKPHLLKKLF